MNPPPPDPNKGKVLMGSIPRKKLPPAQQPSDGAAATAAAASSSSASAGAGAASASGHHHNDNRASPRVPKKNRPYQPLPLSSAAARAPSAASSSSSSKQHHRHHHHGGGAGGGGGGGGSLSRRPSSSSSGSLPRRKRLQEPVKMLSEFPLVMRIRLKGVPMIEGLPQPRSSLRMPKRKQPVSYEEPNEDDLGDFLTDGESGAPSKKRKRAAQAAGPDGVQPGVAGAAAAFPVEGASLLAGGAAAGGAVIVAGAGAPLLPQIEGPPQGVPGALWYSREVFLNIWVLDKVCGWKTRTTFALVDAETGEEVPLDLNKAVAYQNKALTDGNFWTNIGNRMEVSRIVPQKCPVILAMAAEEQELLRQGDSSSSVAAGSSNTGGVTAMDIEPKGEKATDGPAAITATTSTEPKDKIAIDGPAAATTTTTTTPTTATATATTTGSATGRFRLKALQREEVLLVKWRGRSHLHCSWERPADIQRVDLNNTARNKLRRFYQQQEAQYGPDWKKVIEEERTTAATIHSLGAAEVGVQTPGNEQEPDQDDDYFSPQCLEVERILTCDENEMNMQVLAKQRALNIRAEQEAVRLRDEEATWSSEKVSAITTLDSDEKAVKGIRKVIDGLIDLDKKEAPWDPEDNVRYVVKWKGLPFAEMTWEYWRDIKHDAVDEAEDFWIRQRAPDLEQVIQASKKGHPHMRDFRMLQESPAYGVSSTARPVATLDGEDRAPSAVDDDDVDSTPCFKLRSYQLEGVNWLLFNWWNRRSPILADEMGLGKTIQTVAFLLELQTNPAAQVRGPFLIVAPLSLIGQWQSELQSWAPDMNVVLYHGSADAREFIVQNEFYFTEQFVGKATASKLKKNHVTKFHVLITTYEVVLKDIAVLSKVRWRCLIVDEAHRLKNPRAKLFDDLGNVPREYCLLLTGTPIANATEELWALLHFANPTVFDDKDGFLEKFGEVTDAKQVNELHSILKPYLLRRVKDDVEKSLPPKEETILEVSLTPTQKTFYKAIYERNTSFLWKGAKPNNAPSLMNVMMELRKCCNHPYLVRGAEERILAEASAKLYDRKDEQGNPIPIDHVKLFAEQLVKSSGKMVLMEKLLHKLFQGGHKVLIFSQMVRALDLLEELLKLKRYRYERLDGSTSSSSRTHAVERFNRKSMQRFVMLLSTRAGGLGLNLTAADIVIIFDSDFNPQNDLQAMARAHRIGQTRAVQVFRLLTAKTYEMHMFHCASLKLGLERAVLSQNREQSEESDDAKATKNNRTSDREAQAKEIDELLKKGAYDVFRDDDDQEAEKFMEADIDQLIAKNSKKVTYGAAATSSLGSGLGSFSKASFVANTDEGEKDVDLDDPDFWSKAVGLEIPVETSEEVAQMIDDGVKRSRKQVDVYDPYADTAEAEKLKKERFALEKMLEKEEKERQIYEKKMKKKKERELKDKKRREQQEEKKLQQMTEKEAKEAAKAAAAAAAAEAKKEKEKAEPAPPKKPKEIKPKKSKKSDRQRALRRAENEDPPLERLKQAWEVPQRAKATAAAIRFGFGRFCKIRNESNLTSLPLHDLECFVRAYVYQLSLQVAVILLARLHENPDANDLRPLFREWLGLGSPIELDWICDSVQSVMTMQLEVESRRRFLRMPVILAEPVYMDVLRQGAAFRALRRIGFLVRLNQVIEDCIDSILSALGHEELGKRGCAANELSTLDVDLKARYITTEELSLAISSKFRSLKVRDPASWWDRSCDIGLVIGTFVHGLGNYEAMRNDIDLPFADRLRRVAKLDEACSTATQVYRVAASAARKVFDDALEAVRIKAELEVQAAVAAAAKAAFKREEDAAVLRKGGAEAEAIASSIPDTQVENAFEFDGTDSHFVTLPRMHKSITEAVRKEGATMKWSGSEFGTDSVPEKVKSDENTESLNGDTERLRDHQRLPMPDARVLDHRLLLVLQEIENVMSGGELPVIEESNPDLWKKTDDVLTNLQVRRQGMARFVDDGEDRISEYAGVGLGANQCGTSHRTLNDGSDFGFGSGSSNLSQVAYGTDAPRYLRAISVPMNITRFAVAGLLYAESSWITALLETENLRYYGEKEPRATLLLSGEVPSSAKKEEKKQDSPPKDGSSSNTQPAAGSGSGSDKDPKSNALGSGEAGDFRPARKVKRVDPVTRIPVEFRENAILRANVCLAVLFFGFPASSAPGTDGAPAPATTVDPDLWNYYLQQSGSTENPPPPPLFTVEHFRDVVHEMAPDVDIPDAKTLRFYVESVLLPLCVLLCVNGNGPTTRGARGSQGEYETSFGVSLHPEPSETHPSPLPDPCLSLQEHSMEALGQALAILRRVRLLRSCVYICGGHDIRFDAIQTVVRSDLMGAVHDLPVWWCPWIHDVSLLVQAATGGLFSAIPNRPNHAVFSPGAVQQFLYSAIIAKEEEEGSPTALVTSQSSPEQVGSWSERQASKFPTLNQLERRLACLCSQSTLDLNSEARYDSIPMFDHGGWPRN